MHRILKSHIPFIIKSVRHIFYLCNCKKKNGKKVCRSRHSARSSFRTRPERELERELLTYPFGRLPFYLSGIGHTLAWSSDFFFFFFPISSFPSFPYFFPYTLSFPFLFLFVFFPTFFRSRIFLTRIVFLPPFFIPSAAVLAYRDWGGFAVDFFLLLEIFCVNRILEHLFMRRRSSKGIPDDDDGDDDDGDSGLLLGHLVCVCLYVCVCVGGDPELSFEPWRVKNP